MDDCRGVWWCSAGYRTYWYCTVRGSPLSPPGFWGLCFALTARARNTGEGQMKDDVSSFHNRTLWNDTLLRRDDSFLINLSPHSMIR